MPIVSFTVTQVANVVTVGGARRRVRSPQTWTPYQPAWWKPRYQVYFLVTGFAILILFFLFVLYPTVLGP